MDAREDDGFPRHICPDCGHIDHHNPAPAVGAAIIRGDEILLSKRAAAPKKGQWDLVGGFVEAGESGLEALHREVAEETGMRVLQAELVDVLAGDYDGRPTLNLMYIAKAQGEPTAQDDSEELRWFPLHGLPDDLAWTHEAQVLDRMRAMVEELAGDGTPSAPPTQ
jgi:mutator protein MutT